MRTANVCFMNTEAQASFGRHFCHAFNNGIGLSADARRSASVFCVIIISLSLLIKKSYTRVRDMRMLRTPGVRLI